MKSRKSKAENAIDKAIERAYYRHGSGVQVNVMDIPSIFDECRAAAQTSPEALDTQMQAVIAKYRQN